MDSAEGTVIAPGTLAVADMLADRAPMAAHVAMPERLGPMAAVPAVATVERREAASAAAAMPADSAAVDTPVAAGMAVADTGKF
jgi:hypothetical protein